MAIDPKRLHQVDQETGPMHELAIKLGAYQRSLISQGFSREEALELVKSYQAEVIRSIKDWSDGRI